MLDHSYKTYYTYNVERKRKEKNAMPNNFKNDEQRKRWNAYNNQYAKKNYKTICIKFNKESDKDILDYLENSGESPTRVIRELLKARVAGK